MKRVTRPTQIAKNLNHNLYQNPKSKLWWLHYTVHLPNYTTKRIVYSLKTSDVESARIQRDMLFHDLNIKNADAK